MKIIISHTNYFDALMLRSSCKSLFNSHLDLNPFPKHFVLDQNECAAYFIKLGSISCLEYLKSLNFFFTIDLAIIAASNNQLEALKFLRNNGCRLNQQVVVEAARIGNLEMLKYCLENISNKIDMKTNQGLSLCYVAATAGHVHVLKYLHENGYPWDDNIPHMASNCNRFECLKYAVEEGCPVNNIIARSLEAVKFLKARGLEWKTYATQNAVQANDLELLKYAHENGAPCGEAAYYAIIHGALECLKYLIENGAQISYPVETVGSLDVLKYLVEYVPDAVLLPEIFSRAAENAQKDILEYLTMVNKVNRPNALGTLAAESADLEFLKWCIEEQHYDTDTKEYEDGDRIDVLQAAISANFDCVKYVMEKNLGPRLKTHAEYVELGLTYRYGVDFLEYMYNIEKFEITGSMLRLPLTLAAVETLKVLEWMKQHGAKFEEKHVVIAIQSRNVSSMAWLLKQGTFGVRKTIR